MDQTLRTRVRAGDPAAFECLFEECARVVYRYAARVAGDPVAADDIVSLTFLEAWRLRQKVRPDGGSLQPWLLGIATNVLRNTARATRRHQAAMARLPRADTVPDFTDELVHRIGDAEQLAAARAALDLLRPAEREVFTLCVWTGLSHAEAAEALGISPGSVRSRLSRARSRLRRLTDAQLARSREGLQRPGRTGQVRGGRVPAARRNKERTP